MTHTGPSWCRSLLVFSSSDLQTDRSWRWREGRYPGAPPPAPVCPDNIISEGGPQWRVQYYVCQPVGETDTDYGQHQADHQHLQQLGLSPERPSMALPAENRTPPAWTWPTPPSERSSSSSPSWLYFYWNVTLVSSVWLNLLQLLSFAWLRETLHNVYKYHKNMIREEHFAWSSTLHCSENAIVTSHDTKHCNRFLS